MVKESLQEVSETLHDIQRIAQEFWPDALVSSFELLKGGYSATNYHIKTSDNREAVVKICRGYQLPDVENQAAVAAYLASHGFAELCHPYALSGRPGYYAVDFQSFPAIMVNYLPGKGGDVLIEENSLTLVQAASQIGRGLSRMHSIPIALTTCLRSFLDDGICFLGRHYRGEYKRLLQEHEDPFIREHDFVRVYLDRFDFLHSTIQTLIDDESSSRSILHGDAFVDNVLFDASTGRLLGFVDFEDACCGPSILDLAIAIVGNCFYSVDESSASIDQKACRALLEGYFAESPHLLSSHSFSPQRLHAVMQVVLLLNTSWRVINFNITLPQHRESHGQKYKELLHRLEYLEGSEGQMLVTSFETLWNQLA